MAMINTPEVYDVDGSIITVQPSPFVADRDPTTSDTGPLGAEWLNRSTETMFQLVDNTATNTWVAAPAAGSGTFTSVTVDPGDIDVTTGDVNIAGNLTVSTDAAVFGQLTIEAGGSLVIDGDLDLSSADAISLVTTSNTDPAMLIETNGGVLETLSLLVSQGTAADSLKLTSTAGGITLTSNLATADGINLSAVGGGIDVDAALQINIASSQNAGNAIVLNASAGAIDILAAGAAGEDIDITNTAGSVNIGAGESDANAIIINASGAAGGVKIRGGSGGILIGDEADTTPIGIGDVVPTSARTITVSGGAVATAIADTLDLAPDGVNTDAGASKVVNVATGATLLGTTTVNIGSGTAASGTHAVNIASGTGGGTKTCDIGNADGLTTLTMSGPLSVNSSVNQNVDILGGTSTGTFTVGNAAAGAVAIDTAAGISLDGATASNFTVTGAGADLTLSSVGGSVKINSTEDAAGAIALTSNGGVTETITVVNTQGTGASAVALTASAGGITLTSNLATADGINLSAVGGGIDMDSALQTNIASSQAAADAVRIIASDAAGGIDVDCGTGGATVDSTGAISLQAAAASDFSVSGAAIDLTLASAAGSVIVNGEEAAADAVRLLSAAGGLDADFANNISFDNSAGNITLNSAAGTVLLDSAGVLELNSSAGVISIGNDAVSQNIGIGGAGTRAITIGNSTATTSVSINGGTGSSVNIGTNGIAHTVTVGNTTGATAVAINSGTGGINLSSAGIFTLDAVSNTIASPTASTTINANVGNAEFTGFTTAAAATQDFTITNSLVTTASQIFCTVCNEGANDAQISIRRITRAAGSFVVKVVNNGAAALNGNIGITFMVIN